MPKQSAGILPFRKSNQGLEVLLVHPGGPFWAKKDEGAWSISKGEFGDDEEPLEAAKREFQEETGVHADGPLIKLGSVRQSSGKIVHAWAMESEVDATQLKSNTFRMEWPPKSGRQREFPEVDRAEWFPIETARLKIVKGQIPLLDRLSAQLQAE